MAIRDLQNRDVWEVAGIVNELDLNIPKEQVEGIQDWRDLGMLTFQVIIKNLHKVREKANAWLASMVIPEVTPAEFEKMKLKDGIFHVIKEIQKDENLKSFFESVADMIEPKSGSISSSNDMGSQKK